MHGERAETGSVLWNLANVGVITIDVPTSKCQHPKAFGQTFDLL